jgi:hypothetical protein
MYKKHEISQNGTSSPNHLGHSEVVQRFNEEFTRQEILERTSRSSQEDAYLDAFDAFQALEHPNDRTEAVVAAEKLLESRNTTSGTPVGSSSPPVGRKTARLFTGNLSTMTFPALKYAVPDIIPEGLTIFAGSYKIGKSWMLLEFCVEIAMGGTVLGGLAVERGKTLYFALEDGERRVAKRLSKMGAGHPAGCTFGFTSSLSNLDDGGLEELDNTLTDLVDVKLVVVDTLAKVKPRARSNNSYDEDTSIMSKLHALAMKHKTSLVLVTHKRKTAAEDEFNSIIGSVGLQGVADTILLLDKARGSADATLAVTGRDIEERKLALSFNKENCRWQLLGDANFHDLSEERQAILRTLGEKTHYTELAVILGKSDEAVKALLQKMLKDGQVERLGDGYYTRAGDKKEDSNEDELVI